jgi:hypothetical protein
MRCQEDLMTWGEGKGNHARKRGEGKIKEGSRKGRGEGEKE